MVKMILIYLDNCQTFDMAFENSILIMKNTNKTIIGFDFKNFGLDINPIKRDKILILFWIQFVEKRKKYKPLGIVLINELYLFSKNI